MKSKKKMKRKRMKKGMLLAELYRLFTVRRLMTGIFLVAIIAVISVSDLISIDSINWPAELKQSICDQLQITLVFDRYKSLYVIAASICTVTTFPSDIKNHVLPYIRQRTDFDSMMNARLFAIAAYIIVTMIGGGSLPWILSYSSLTSEPGRASVGEVIYHVVFFTICSLAAAKCVKAVMQKRFLNGMD